MEAWPAARRDHAEDWLRLGCKVPELPQSAEGAVLGLSCGGRLPGDAGLTRAMQEDAGLFQAAHRVLMKGMPDEPIFCMRPGSIDWTAHVYMGKVSTVLVSSIWCGALLVRQACTATRTPAGR